jgi:hypothetical protein
VQVDHHARTLTLWVTGSQASRYFSELHREVRCILERMNVEYDEFVYLPAAARLDKSERQVSMGNVRPKANFRDLLAHEADGEPLFRCSYGKYNVAEVLKIMPKKDRNEYSQEIHIHNSTHFAIARGDQKHFDFSQNKTVLVAEAREFRKQLVNLIDDIETNVKGSDIREAALRELQMIRTSLQAIENGSEAEQRSALEAIKIFGEKLKNTTSRTYELIKEMKEGSEVLEWLIKWATTLAGFLS